MNRAWKKDFSAAGMRPTNPLHVAKKGGFCASFVLCSSLFALLGAMCSHAVCRDVIAVGMFPLTLRVLHRDQNRGLTRLDTRFRELQRRGNEIAGDSTRQAQLAAYRMQQAATISIILAGP